MGNKSVLDKKKLKMGNKDSDGRPPTSFITSTTIITIGHERHWSIHVIK